MPFAHLTIATRDVEGTSAFFVEALRWKRVSIPRNTPIEAVWLEIGPGQQIHILGVEDFEVSPFEREFGRHVAVFHPGEITLRHEQRKQLGRTAGRLTATIGKPQ